MKKRAKTLEAGWWFILGTPVSFTNKTDLLDITETLVENCLQHTNPH
jgi:hypothetical protein